MSGSDRNVVERLALTEPIIDQGAPLRELAFRKPKALDLKVSEQVKGDHAQTIVLISRLTGLPEPVIDTLAIADYAAASEVVARFLDERPGTPS